jgi:hypothetical protein
MHRRRSAVKFRPGQVIRARPLRRPQLHQLQILPVASVRNQHYLREVVVIDGDLRFPLVIRWQSGGTAAPKYNLRAMVP